MESELIDSAFNQPDRKKENQSRVRILSGILFIVILPLSVFCYTDIIWFIQNYAIIRGKYLFGTESLHGMVSSFFISIIPVIAYYCWLKRTNDQKNGTAFYLMLVLFTAGLFFLFFVLQLELIFEFSRPVRQNPFLPSNVVVPPFSFCFDLFFIVSALFSFLSLKGLIYISNKRNLPSRK
ncbi:hypothetical protein [Fluviicola sp.]|uniref:hypothetical protein n=1 Tax=Fluviicola sp. TaxID=1917219 RepID=UPI00260D6241|nr:hypothetical protein [Fluviicola sp.]